MKQRKKIRMNEWLPRETTSHDRTRALSQPFQLSLDSLSIHHVISIKIHENGATALSNGTISRKSSTLKKYEPAIAIRIATFPSFPSLREITTLVRDLCPNLSLQDSMMAGDSSVLLIEMNEEDDEKKGEEMMPYPSSNMETSSGPS